MAKKNDFVRIHRNILAPTERTGKLPADTQAVPLEMWVKGYLAEEYAQLGDTVTVTTCVGREVRGCLVEINPSYDLNYGAFLPEILEMDRRLRNALWEGGEV